MRPGSEITPGPRNSGLSIRRPRQAGPLGLSTKHQFRGEMSRGGERNGLPYVSLRLSEATQGVLHSSADRTDPSVLRDTFRACTQTEGFTMDRSAFDAHPIWASTTSLDSALTLAEAQNDASVSSQLGEVRYLVSLIRSHATPTDVAPYSVTGLDAVNGSLPNITSELNNFVSNGNPQHATNAASYSDAVLNQIGSWPTQTLKGGAAGVANRLFAEYRDAAEAALTAMRASNREMAEKLDSQQTESAAAIAALRSDLADLTVKITADETRLDTALTTSNEAFTAKQTEREEKFTAWLAEQGKAQGSCQWGSRGHPIPPHVSSIGA